MTAEHDVAAADWLERSSAAASRPGLRRLVPAGFEATLRIHHPFWREGEPVSWQELLGDAPLRWDTSIDDVPGRGVHDPNPWLDLPQATALVEALRDAGDDDPTIWIGACIAWGLYERFSAFPTYRGPRECLLHRGSLDTVVSEIERDSAPIVEGDPVLRPYQWWPHDRRWYVISDIDVNSTLVAGERRLLDRVQDRVESRFLPDDRDDPDLSFLTC
ncbi:hypothetical protein GCM10022237_35490 [Nocardioides ginsengisoli]|uniref:Uncharacterized protein n=1 Tax=Nocardioides ginsengisoli TaxID=363868 RepID=A0ABW3W0C2_9ACTN